jgi:hypothetical protein
MNPEKATALRRPFPPESVGKLPKGGVMLDYVGHAAVTDRLLSVDPEWSWEPFAVTPEGLPALDRSGNLWIRLTICGVTRIGVGDGKNAKEVVGDAIRNAAMRFGVALDLWAKENLVEFAQAASGHQRPQPTPETARPAPESPIADLGGKAAKRMFALIGDLGVPDDEMRDYIARIIGRPIASRKELTDADVSAVIKATEASLDQPFPQEAS